MEFVIPVVCKGQKSAIELFRLGICSDWRVRGIAMTVYNFCNLAILDPCGAVPGVHNVLVFVRAHLTKNNHLPITLVGYWDNLTNGRHPATNESVIDLPGFERFAQLGRILNGMISPGVTATVNGSDIIGFFGAYKCCPRPRILLCR